MPRSSRRSFLGHRAGTRWRWCVPGAESVAALALRRPVAGWAGAARSSSSRSHGPQVLPAQPGGLLAIEAVAIGLTSRRCLGEVVRLFPCSCCLIFMVAGIYFLRDLLLFVFSACCSGCTFSARCSRWSSAASRRLLSALPRRADRRRRGVTVGLGYYEIYHRAASGKATRRRTTQPPMTPSASSAPRDARRSARSCAASHVTRRRHGDRRVAQVGEPQNLLIARARGLELSRSSSSSVAPVSIPVAIAGAGDVLPGRQAAHWLWR